MNIVLTLTSLLIFAFSLLPSQVHAAANTYYVTQNGNGARSGQSLGSAWSVSDFNRSANWSISDNPNRIDPGDTVYFSGTITSTLYPQGSGSSGKYITLDGYESGNCDPINSECTGSAEITNSSSSIRLTTQDYIIIQDFRIDGGGLDFLGTSKSNDSSYIIIRRNEIHDIEGNGINIDYGDYFTIGGAYGDGNEMYDIGIDTSDGDISPYWTDDIIISYNHLFATKSNGNSRDRGIDGIVTHHVNRMLVEYNSIHSHNDRYGSDARGEDGMDLKQETHNVIIRFNKIYDHLGQTNITLQGGTNDVYIYGNLLNNASWAAVLVYGRKKGFASLDNIHIWSNVMSGNKKNAIAIYSDGDDVGKIYIYNNTLAYSGVRYTDIYDRAHTPDQWYCGLRLLSGTAYIKNNILYRNQPKISTYIQANSNSTYRIRTLEHNTYYWPGKTSYFDYGGGKRSVATLQTTYGLEDDSPAGETSNPGLTDPNGADNIYGTEDDNYTLDGTNIDNGKDLSRCFDVSVQGRNYHMCYNDALDPRTTNWEINPPIVRTTKQENYGSWDRGAYVYTGDTPSQELSPPRLLQIVSD